MKFRVIYPLALVLALVVLPALGVFIGNGCIEHREPNRQAEQSQIVVADTTDPLSTLKLSVQASLDQYDRLLAMKGARPYPNDQLYVELGIYNQLEYILESAIGDINQSAKAQTFKQEEIAMYAMSNWGVRFAQFIQLHTSSMGGAYEPTGHDWAGIGRMAATYIPLIERGFALSFGTASQIRAGSE